MGKLKRVLIRKREFIAYFALGIIAALAFLWFSAQNSLGENNLELEYIRWSSLADMDNICSSCHDDNIGCMQDAEFSLRFNGIDPNDLKGQNRELQCKMIIDSVDLYKEDGKYFCNFRESIESTIKLNISKAHDFMICCGSDGLDFDALKPGELQPEFVCRHSQLAALCGENN